MLDKPTRQSEEVDDESEENAAEMLAMQHMLDELQIYQFDKIDVNDYIDIETAQRAMTGDMLSAEDIVSLISNRPVVDVGDGNSAEETVEVIVEKPKISISEAIDHLNKVKDVLESSQDWNIDMDDDLENLKQALRKMRVSKQTSIFDFFKK